MYSSSVVPADPAQRYINAYARTPQSLTLADAAAPRATVVTLHFDPSDVPATGGTVRATFADTTDALPDATTERYCAATSTVLAQYLPATDFTPVTLIETARRVDGAEVLSDFSLDVHVPILGAPPAGTAFPSSAQLSIVSVEYEDVSNVVTSLTPAVAGDALIDFTTPANTRRCIVEQQIVHAAAAPLCMGSTFLAQWTVVGPPPRGGDAAVRPCVLTFSNDGTASLILGLGETVSTVDSVGQVNLTDWEVRGNMDQYGIIQVVLFVQMNSAESSLRLSSIRLIEDGGAEIEAALTFPASLPPTLTLLNSGQALATGDLRPQIAMATGLRTPQNGSGIGTVRVRAAVTSGTVIPFSNGTEPLFVLEIEANPLDDQGRSLDKKRFKWSSTITTGTTGMLAAIGGPSSAATNQVFTFEFPFLAKLPVGGTVALVVRVLEGTFTFTGNDGVQRTAPAGFTELTLDPITDGGIDSTIETMRRIGRPAPFFNQDGTSRWSSEQLVLLQRGVYNPNRTSLSLLQMAPIIQLTPDEEARFLGNTNL